MESPAPAGWTLRVQARAVAALACLLRLLPRRAVPSVGAFAGAVYGRLDRRRRRVALENLERALGRELPRAERTRIAERVFRHFGRAAFEMLTLDRYGASDAGTLIEYEGIEHIRAAYAAGRGAFLFSAHFGNWELVALMQGYQGMPLAMITRTLDNPLIEGFMRRRREASGNQVVPKRNAIRQALRALGDGMGVAIVIDQNVRAGARLFVDYFGTPASTTPTLALLALKTGAPIIPVFSYPGPGGSYRVVYGPPVPVETTGDRERDVRALTERCTKIIEQQVRARPDLWLWMHARWKRRPRPTEWPPPAR